MFTSISMYIVHFLFYFSLQKFAFFLEKENYIVEIHSKIIHIFITFNFLYIVKKEEMTTYNENIGTCSLVHHTCNESMPVR